MTQPVTRSGFLAELGRLATVGDTVECEGVRLQVERVQGRRIMRVRIDRTTDEGEFSPDEEQAMRKDPQTGAVDAGPATDAGSRG